jgi:hypothetical protein
MILDPATAAAPETPGMVQQALALAGWVPAAVFPAASVLQLLSLAKRGRSDGASATTWSLFALANVCLYLTIGDWFRPQVVIATLGSACLQVVVVVMILRLRKSPDKTHGHPSGSK